MYEPSIHTEWCSDGRCLANALSPCAAIKVKGHVNQVSLSDTTGRFRSSVPRLAAGNTSDKGARDGYAIDLKQVSVSIARITIRPPPIRPIVVVTGVGVVLVKLVVLLPQSTMIGAVLAAAVEPVFMSLGMFFSWTSPDLVESHFLRRVVGLECCLECGGAYVAKARMPPPRVIEAFDVKANGVAGFNA